MSTDTKIVRDYGNGIETSVPRRHPSVVDFAMFTEDSQRN